MLKEKYVDHPTSEDDWRAVAKKFEQKWNFSHCIVAIDGKHIVMQAPGRSGSYYFNYKKSHSIVLIAVCNGNYQFTLLDIGDTGRNSDGGVFGNSDMETAFESNLLHIPGPEELSNTRINCPMFWLGMKLSLSKST